MDTGIGGNSGVDLALIGAVFLVASCFAFLRRAAFVDALDGLSKALFPSEKSSRKVLQLLSVLVLGGIALAALAMIVGGLYFAVQGQSQQ